MNRIEENASNLATVCVLCSHNCGLRVDVAENKIVAVRADETNPVTQGYVCNKGYSIPHYVEHEQRVQTPLKRQADGQFAPIGWDQAISEIGTKVRSIKDRYSGRAVGLVGVGGQANHLDGAYALAFLLGLESPWWFNALAQEKTQHALVDKWLFDAYPTTHFHADIEHSEFALMIGTNPLLSNRGSKSRDFVRAFSDDKRTLVVVDPRRTETAKKADIHLTVKPGGDVYMLLAIAAVILQEQLHDRGFVDRYVGGFESLRTKIGSLDVAELCGFAGLDVEDVRTVARGFAAAESASIFVDLGLEQSRYSTLTAYLMRVVAGLTGNLGNRGGMSFMGLFGAAGPELKKSPPIAPVSGIEGIAMWTPIAGYSYNLVPEEVLADRDDRIRALFVEGSNPMLQAADTPKWREAIDALDILVVIEPAMSETARLADYVLPALCGYEKWEYAGFPKGYPGVYAQVRPPVVRGPEQALSEPEIYHRLARAAGLTQDLPRPLKWLAASATSPWKAPIALAAMVAYAGAKSRSVEKSLPRMLFGLYETLGTKLKSPALVFIWFTCMTYALAQRKDLLRAHPEAARFKNPFALGAWLFEQLMDHPEGFHVGDIDAATNLDTILRTKDRKIAFDQPQMFDEIAASLSDLPAKDDAYPLILDAGMRTRWNANSVQRDPVWRKGKGPHCGVWVSPHDATERDLVTGATVRVASKTGSVELPVVVHDSVISGHIHIPNGFGQLFPDGDGNLVEVGVNVNELTDAQSRDRFTGCPYHKYVPCRLESA